MMTSPRYATAGRCISQSAVVARAFAPHGRSMPSRLLYDERGSELFERDYAPRRILSDSRREEILRARAEEIAEFCGKGVLLIEYGAGAGVKTEILLAALDKPATLHPDRHRQRRARAHGNPHRAERFPASRPFRSSPISHAISCFPRELPRGPRTAFFPDRPSAISTAARRFPFCRGVRRRRRGTRDRDHRSRSEKRSRRPAQCL